MLQPICEALLGIPVRVVVTVVLDDKGTRVDPIRFESLSLIGLGDNKEGTQAGNVRATSHKVLKMKTLEDGHH